VTYKGDRVRIRNNTSTEVIESALIRANLIMFQKIANVLSIVSFLMVASMSAGAFVTYRFVTSEQFKSQVMNQILSEVSGSMGKVLDKQLPKSTGISIPFNGN
tara:strand:- start:161 stop:469 length:309 start_codon:yes stop_codon:yes gene_type:complete